MCGEDWDVEVYVERRALVWLIDDGDGDLCYQMDETHEREILHDPRTSNLYQLEPDVLYHCFPGRLSLQHAESDVDEGVDEDGDGEEDLVEALGDPQLRRPYLSF